MPPVLAAGVGARRGWTWALRAASFRMEAPLPGRAVTGISVPRGTAASAVIDLLAGATAPAYGELRVLGEDLTTPAGRVAVRGRIGVARRPAGLQRAFRLRGVIGHAARQLGLPAPDREMLTAAILDRLALTPWARVPLRAAPPAVARRAQLAAAAVHEPELLLLDRLLDDLTARDAASVAAAIRDLGRDTAIIATGAEPDLLWLACDDVLTLANGIIVPS
jgi:ABC-type multidrug transport system ATPase subunit